MPNLQTSCDSVTPSASAASGIEVPRVLSEGSALSADSGKERVDAGLSQLSAKITLPIAPQNPEDARATPPGSADAGSTQPNEPSTNVTAALPPNANDVDMGDATQELSKGVKAVTGGIILQKAQSEPDVEMIDGTHAIGERGGMEKRAEEGVEKTVDVREAPAVPMELAVEGCKATTQIVLDGIDVDMTDAEAGVTAVREGEPAESASGSKGQKGALVEDETLDVPVEPSMGNFKASVKVLPAYTATEMTDGHAAEAGAAGTGKGENTVLVPELKAQEGTSVEDHMAQPSSKKEIREAVVGVDVMGHDSVLYSMDPEEEGGGSLLEQAKGMCNYSPSIE